MGGWVSGVWKDITTPNGIPLFTLDKSHFDKLSESISSFVPIVDKSYLADLASFDALELLSAVVSALAIIFGLKKEGKEDLSWLLGSLGVSSILTANPILGIGCAIVVCKEYIANKRKVDDKKLSKGKAFKGGAVSLMSFGLFSVLSLSVLIQLVLIGVLTSVLKKKVIDNSRFQDFVKREIVIKIKGKAKKILSSFSKSEREQILEMKLLT